MDLRRVVAVIAVGCVLACGWLGRPVRWEVEGLSMAPGLMPGDVVASGLFPGACAGLPARRFDRWIVRTPDGRLGVKRLIGLPGETLGLVDGDLEVDGRRVVRPPATLAEVATRIDARVERLPDGGVLVEPRMPVFDDAAFAPGERRLLLEVPDVGMVAVVEIGSPRPGHGVTVDVAVGSRLARVRIDREGRFAVVAGRLDGRFVVGGWPVVTSRQSNAADGQLVPRTVRESWDVQSRWVEDSPESGRLVCRIGPVCGFEDGRASIADCGAWRDVLYRPAADGVTEWRLGGADVFVLGDFPSGSVDCRHWGPIGLDDLRHRVETVRRTGPPPGR